jgi:hypothetical protein
VNGFIGHANVKRVTIRLGEDCNSLDAHALSSAHHTKCDLTTVRDEDLLEELKRPREVFEQFVSVSDHV